MYVKAWEDEQLYKTNDNISLGLSSANRFLDCISVTDSFFCGNIETCFHDRTGALLPLIRRDEEDKEFNHITPANIVRFLIHHEGGAFLALSCSITPRVLILECGKYAASSLMFGTWTKHKSPCQSPEPIQAQPHTISRSPVAPCHAMLCLHIRTESRS